MIKPKRLVLGSGKRGGEKEGLEGSHSTHMPTLCPHSVGVAGCLANHSTHMPTLCPHPVGVAGCLAKIKVAYETIQSP